jgi:hypothetical protein
MRNLVDCALVTDQFLIVMMSWTDGSMMRNYSVCYSEADRWDLGALP